MMEIYEQRRRDSRWLWIGAAGVLLAVILWAITRADEANEYSAGDVAAPAATLGERPPVVLLVATRRYLDFAKQAPDFGDINRAHEYTANGLRYLAGALQELSATPANRAKIAALKASADDLGEQHDVTHAEIVAVTFKQAADALAEVQRNRFPSLAAETAQVHDAAAAMDPKDPLLQQSQKIKTFFAAAATLLEHMGAAAPAATPASDTGADS